MKTEKILKPTTVTSKYKLVINSIKDFDLGIELLMGYFPIKVDKILGDDFQLALNKTLVEDNIWFFSSTRTAFKKHYRFQRNKENN